MAFDFLDHMTDLEAQGSFDARAFPIWLDDHRIDLEDERAIAEAWDLYDGWVALAGLEYERRDLATLRMNWLRESDPDPEGGSLARRIDIDLL